MSVYSVATGGSADGAGETAAEAGETIMTAAPARATAVTPAVLNSDEIPTVFPLR
ncbi:hypothetical protein ACQPZF_28445 [Actinosynnema sp. CS-041913]|uniref:hypothetical protein n=1 Tax=Actinosynnema sp. CS-041913 TaxID=3239917 RepID=UPI003D8A305F